LAPARTDRRRSYGEGGNRGGGRLFGKPFRVWRLRATRAYPQWWAGKAGVLSLRACDRGVDRPRSGSPGATSMITTAAGTCGRGIAEHSRAAEDLPARGRRAGPGGRCPCRECHPWLSDDWIATHLGRYQLETNAPWPIRPWPAAIEQRTRPAIRELVAARVIDPAEIARLRPNSRRALDNHDSQRQPRHVGDQVVIIDGPTSAGVRSGTTSATGPVPRSGRFVDRPRLAHPRNPLLRSLGRRRLVRRPRPGPAIDGSVQTNSGWAGWIDTVPHWRTRSPTPSWP